MRRTLPLCFLLLLPLRAEAHRLAPSLLELRELVGNRVVVLWKTPILRSAGSDLRPSLPEHCTRWGEESVVRTELALIRRWELSCEDPGLVGAELAIAGLSGSGTDVLIQVQLRDGRRLRAVASARQPRFTVPSREKPLRVIADYALLGIEHLATGFDHLLFVSGLLLLVRGRRGILLAVTAFTVGHSVTLALAALDFVFVPLTLVEIGIAASLVVLAIELADGAAERRRHPWLLALAFGLLHGFGFARALSEAGLPGEAIPLSLFSFNLGIEVGQLLFVALALGAFALAHPLLERAPATIARLPIYAIGSLGVFWCLERGARLL